MNSPIKSLDELRDLYNTTRQKSIDIVEPLETEDLNTQSMCDTSPPKWHLAHTTWFETFLLKKMQPSYRCFDENFAHLFNSYYETLGSFHPRNLRGMLTRPTAAQIFNYRRHVDEAMQSCFNENLAAEPDFTKILFTGIRHEQQHQELLYMDIKHNLFSIPQRPAYLSTKPMFNSVPKEQKWLEIKDGIYFIGADNAGFSYDNERGRHRVFIENCALSSRLATNQEYLDFINSDGYRRPELWLSEGWSYVQKQNHHAPYYWFRNGDQWFEFTLHGVQELNPYAPVSHVSYFEADAFARWSKSRLPTEFEWEVLANDEDKAGVFDSHSNLHPYHDDNEPSILGNLWQWTSSSYSPYPRFTPESGAMGEYNGKFMCNQYVLRGGSFASPSSHIRATYRNFFPSHSSWMFSGVRLAKDLP